MKTGPLIFEHRTFNYKRYQQICEALSKTDWSSLNSSDAEACYNITIDDVNDVIEYFAPNKITKILPNM
jgi:predicted transcriptional regulator of viral defense system